MDEPVGGVADGLTLGRRGEPGTRAVPSTHGLVTVPPLAMVNAEVSWHEAGMSRWARLVLS